MARTPLVEGTSLEPVSVIAIRIARARALNEASAMWWLFVPRIESTCSVTPEANANDSRKCEIISVETDVS